MHIVVIANGEDQKAFQDKELPTGVVVQFFATMEEAKTDADAYFYFGTEDEGIVIEQFQKIKVPLFIKDSGLYQKALAENFVLLKGWPESFANDSLEVEISGNNISQVNEVFSGLGWQFNHK